MQTCHVEVGGAVLRHSPAEPLAAPWDSLPDADRLRWISVSVSSHPLMVAVEEGKMSGAAAGDTASARTGEPGRPRRDPGYEPGDGKKRGPSQGILITIIGAVVTAGIATAAVFPGPIGGKPSGPPGDAEPTLSALAPADITTALPTLDQATSKAAVEDAKSCKAPLAWVTLVKRPSSRGGMVRISSGSYLSPPFLLTDAPQRIAIPYPAPYPTGRGVLSLVGDADEVWFYLTPGWFVQTLKGTASINVHWTPRNPC
jgi:hypothetical protein